MLNASKIVVRTPFQPIVFEQTKEAFEQVLRSAVFKEALFLGSPDLCEELEKASEVLNEEAKLSLYKYFLRMSYRCTPFGMFSGVSAGTIGTKTVATIVKQSSYRKHSRCDNHFINTFVQKIVKDNGIKFSVNWYANNTIYRNGDALRYVEYRLTNSQRNHHLAKVETSTYLDSILERARLGAKIKELMNALVSNEVTEEEAAAFIDELIESKLLVSELEPVVTGQEPHKALLHVLEKYESGEEHALFFKKIVEQIYTIESQPPGTDIAYYKEVMRWVKKWDDGYDPKLIFQSDLSKPSSAMQLSGGVLDDLQEVIAFLGVLNGATTNTNLNKFKEEFTKRYEDDEVPLLEVMDTESGIGYPPGAHTNNDQAPLLQGLNLNTSQSTTEYKVATWQKKLVQLYQQCIEQGSTEVVVTNETFSVDPQAFDKNLLPNSLYTICTILGTPEEVEADQCIIDYKGSSGPSAANLLGRFCYVDSDIKSIVDELIQQEEEQHPDKILAEVVHLAQARVGNVLIRPSFRKYEIPILSFPSVDDEHTVNLKDVVVSVKNNRVVLRSKKHDKEVVPRNTTAHNYANDSVPHYHFLCDLQQQESGARLNWDWGMLNEFKFLPRIKYRNIILAKARWIIDVKDLVDKPNQSQTDFNTSIEKYKASQKLPRWVVLSQGDNQLPLDLTNDLSLKILKQELTRNKRIVVEECLYNENNLVVTGPEGGFTNEVIIPWIKEKEAKLLEANNSLRPTHVERTFVPGSSWHYIKIYCGVKTSDKILTDVIKPLVDELLEAGILLQWFFIRYTDPDYHLRVRFKGSNQLLAILAEKLNQRLFSYLSTNQVWKIQWDTYKRELNRYGYENIEGSELLFFHDSMAVIEILKLLEGDEGDELRWKFALKGVNDMLSDFGYTVEEMENLMISLREGFRKEFKATSKESQKQLSEHFRKYRKDIEFILSPEIDQQHEYEEVWKIAAKKRSDWADSIQMIKDYTKSEESNLSLDNLLGSYIHMFLNRFMRSKQRAHELVIYDFLSQHYHSTIARQKKKVSEHSINGAPLSDGFVDSKTSLSQTQEEFEKTKENVLNL